ncbi:cytidylyltransferase domain-containing protein [Spirillospora sp. NPDC048911]|uniref:cytidylyltransferase domain-containing protein n=1 Tax=Spirillospora sp. NPDC048911 TaxID=3364527 RepID=UPI00372376D3
MIQARMGSSRLPGKVLRPLAGRSVLGWVVRAALESGVLDDLVVATTTLAEDDAITAECRRLRVACHRGPVDDVLSRFMGALETHPADAVMRFTADCPLLDPAVARTAAAAFRAVPGLDYLSTGIPHTLPRGLDVEIIGAAALHRVHALATDHHRTHVTSYAYTHPRAFELMGLTFSPSTAHLRVTLDTPDDWALVEAVAAKFGDVPVPRRELVDWLDLHPGVRALNAHVRQKELAEA